MNFSFSSSLPGRMSGQGIHNYLTTLYSPLPLNNAATPVLNSRQADSRKRIPVTQCLQAMVLSLTALIFHLALSAQTADGSNGISQANTMVRGYFEAGTQLLYAAGALVGLIGAWRVYDSFQGKDGRAMAHAVSWFGSCIFLVVVASVLKSFFGL